MTTAPPPLLHSAAPQPQQIVFPVEVRNPETLSYFAAEIKEIRNGSVLIHYDHSWREDEWVSPDRLRVAPLEKFNPADFNPESGSMVEVQAQAKEGEPPCWWLAHVKTCRGQMYLVNFVNCGDECNDILEKDKLRPVNKSPCLSVADLEQKEVPILKHLWDTAHLEDFESLRASAGIVSAFMDHEKHVLVLIGSRDSLNRAVLVVKVICKHLTEIQALEAKTAKHQEQLQVLKQRQREGLQDEFKLSRDLIGLVIGKGGKNVQDVEKLDGVLRVRIDSENGIVKILAKTQEALVAARARLEYTEDRYSIPASQVGLIVGKGFKNLREIERDSQTRIRVDAPAPERSTDDRKSRRQRPPDLLKHDQGDVDLVVTGRKDHVAVARQLLDTHVRFLAEKQKLVAEERTLQQQVRELSLNYGEVEAKFNATKGKGRRGKKDENDDIQEEDEKPEDSEDDGTSKRRRRRPRNSRNGKLSSDGESAPAGKIQQNDEISAPVPAGALTIAATTAAITAAQ